MNTQDNQIRPELTFDGFGINGPDEYRSRIATFSPVSRQRDVARQYGPLFAASPDMRAALVKIAGDGPFADASGDTESVDNWLARQGEAGLRLHIDFLRDLAREALALMPKA